MKNLLLAVIFFGVVLWGCHDVVPFKAIRRAIRRTPRQAQPPAPPAEPVGTYAAYEPRPRRYR